MCIRDSNTYKNNGTDITGARLQYRVYPTGSPSGSFTAVNLPFAENLPNPGDQRWAQTGATVDVLGSLGNGNYTCLLYTSDAAAERSSGDLGGRRIIKKKKR